MATFEKFANDPLTFVKNGIDRQDPLVIGILVSLVVGFLTIVILAILGSGRNKRRGVLLVGLCDAGKTLLFSRLVFKEYIETQTSMKENSGMYTLPTDKGGVLQVTDLPGHEKIRNQMLDKYKDSARAIVFVVDSLAFTKEIKDCAEYLYNLLTDKVIVGHKLPFLVACTKQDNTMAKGSRLIKSQLEKEFNKVRISQSAMLQGTDNSSSSNIFLGKKNKDFEFSDLKGIKVDFVECSCKGENQGATEGQLSDIYQWLEKIA